MAALIACEQWAVGAVRAESALLASEETVAALMSSEHQRLLSFAALMVYEHTVVVLIAFEQAAVGAVGAEAASPVPVR